MIRFENISIQTQGHLILDRVSFEIQHGEKAIFFGPSGSGKTTILMALIGGIVPTSGAVWFMEEELTSRNLPQLRQTVAFIGQEPVLGAEGVRESLLLPFSFRANRNHAPSEQQIQEALDRVLLQPAILSKKTSVLSGGEKQRLAVARAMLLGKTTFVLDEITSALDPQSRQAVMSCFRQSDITLVSVSHDPEWIALGTRFFKVEQGRATMQNTPPRFEHIKEQGG